jgi:hypothetical protein
MVNADPSRSTSDLPPGDVNPPFAGDGYESPVDEIAAEAGIDLADASDLDADNVPADEENDRVLQAPD